MLFLPSTCVTKNRTKTYIYNSKKHRETERERIFHIQTALANDKPSTPSTMNNRHVPIMLASPDRIDFHDYDRSIEEFEQAANKLEIIKNEIRRKHHALLGTFENDLRKIRLARYYELADEILVGHILHAEQVIDTTMDQVRGQEHLSALMRFHTLCRIRQILINSDKKDILEDFTKYLAKYKNKVEKINSIDQCPISQIEDLLDYDVPDGPSFSLLLDGVSSEELLCEMRSNIVYGKKLYAMLTQFNAGVYIPAEKLFNF